MKTTLQLCIVAAMLILRVMHAQSQCSSTEISLTGTPYTYHNAAGSAVAWQAIPINADTDGIRDDGYVAVGVTELSVERTVLRS
jgi:hypothetical protein